MKLVLKFFDKESWSALGTVRVLIPFILFIITKQELNVMSLIFMSILGMMDGTLLAKIVFTGFLCFLVYEPTKHWIIRSMLYVISVLLMDRINNVDFITKNTILLNIFRLVVLVWMCYILYLIIFPISKWTKLMKDWIGLKRR